MNAGVRSVNVTNRPAVSDDVLVHRDGSLGLQTTADLATQLAATGAIAERIASASGKWVSFATEGELEADLGWPAGQEARVYNDPGKGVYRKMGGAGSGSWTLLGPIPEADTTQLQAQVDARRMIFVAANGQISYDRYSRTLTVPALYGQRYNGSAWNLGPVAGDNYRRITENSANVVTVYIDIEDLTANGAASPTALKIDTIYPSPLTQGNEDIVVLGHIYQQKWFPAGNVKFGRVIANECGFTKEDNDLADLKLTQFLEPVNLANPDAIAEGHTRGWRATGGTGLFIGARFKEALRRGVVFYRFKMDTDIDNSFGTPRIVLVSPAINSGNVQLNPTTERIVSTKYRVYSGFLSLNGTQEYIGLFFGSTNNNGQVRSFGFEFAVMADEDGFVLEGDAPRAASLVGYRLRALESSVVVNGDMTLLAPAKLGFVKERGYPLHLDQMLGSRSGNYMFGVSSTPANRKRPLDVMSSDGTIDIDPARLGSSLNLRLFNRGSYRQTGSQLTIGTVIAELAELHGFQPKVLFMMDSHGDWNGTPLQTWWQLREITGVDPIFIGTTPLNQTGETFSVLGECRQSAEIADLTYKNTDFLAPLPAGQEAAYLAMSKTDKRGYNVLIRPVIEGDNLAHSFNGYIIDVPWYCGRFGLDLPNVFPLGYGTNDITQLLAAGASVSTIVAQVIESLTVTRARIRAGVLDGLILVVWDALGVTDGDSRWNGAHRAVLKAVIDFIKDLNDPLTVLLPIYATVSRLNAFPWTAGTPDADTGVAPISVTDAIHYSMPEGVAAYGNVAAQAIAAFGHPGYRLENAPNNLGFFTADARYADSRTGGEVYALRKRSGAASVDIALQATATTRAKLEIPAGKSFAGLKAVLTETTSYTFAHSMNWGSAVFFWFAFRSVEMARDQFLFRIGSPFYGYIPANTSDLVLFYGGAAVKTIPITHGEDTLIMIGLPGSNVFRTWKNGAMLPDETATYETLTASMTLLASTMAGGGAWGGYLYDFQAFNAYAPATAPWIASAIQDYARLRYGVQA
ncbi:hypothetical protein [Neorhizobium petrolearium]|uniref:hypothetical protein n=1 Tax=Neorhizobium petrolearium TaxID=515361 RepID=UPI003F7FF12D